MDSCLKIAELSGLPAAAEGSNFVFSPLSLRAALSLTAAGAGGETLHQLLYFLGSTSLDDLHSASSRLVEAVRKSAHSDLILSFVSGVWIDRSIAVNPSFMEIASSIYDAEAQSVDFIHQAPIEEMKINTWIEENTNKIIKNIIPDGSLDHSTRLILANALYFKGKWEEKFDSSMTKEEKFNLLDGTTVEVPFMSSRKDQFISSFDGFKVLMLPYKKQGSRSFSMLFFLPNQRDGLPDLIRRAVSNPSFIEKHIPYKRVHVSGFMVPKFRISFKLEATDFLKNLDLRNIFSSVDADLRGMFLESSRGEGVFVSNIYHKAAVEVDEEGTTAAAATAMTVYLTSYSPPVSFVADHPFFFIVREDATGAILFLGHIVNPLLH